MNICCCLVNKSCPTLCDSLDGNPPGSSVHGFSQARIPESVSISFSRGSSWPRDQTSKSLALAGRFFTTEQPGKLRMNMRIPWSEGAQSHPNLCDPTDCSLLGFLCPWDFPGKSTGVGCHFLLQGIFPTQGLNPGFWHCRHTLHPLSHHINSWEYPKKDILQALNWYNLNPSDGFYVRNKLMWKKCNSLVMDHLLFCSSRNFNLKTALKPPWRLRMCDTRYRFWGTLQKITYNSPFGVKLPICFLPGS